MTTQTALSYLDGYCERAGHAGALAEPVNLVTNLFFMAGAVVAIYLILRLPPEPTRKRFDLSLLALSLLSIGIGSGLWHLKPTSATVLMDVIPITLFINLYLISAMRRILQFSWLRVGVWWGAYTALTVTAQLTLPPDTLNGTVMYLPTYLALSVLSVAVALRSRYLGRIFISMLLLWSLSLFFRTMDMEWCRDFPMGTHFLWHTLNAWVLYRLLTALIRYRAPVISFTIPEYLQ